MKIYTRKGDDGTTGLWYGGRVSKADGRPEAYGALDEAASALGMCRPVCDDEEVHADVLRIQTELFVAGAELATAPEAAGRLEPGVSMVTQEMLAVSLASCTAITIEMYAKRKGWDIGEVAVDVNYEPAQRGSPTKFKMVMRLPKELPEEQRERLTQIAAKCPVHRTLEGEVMFEESVELS